MTDLILEADPSGCGVERPCPKIWSTGDYPETIWVQGRRPPAELLARLNPPDDDFVVGFPRQAALDWAAGEREEREG